MKKKLCTICRSWKNKFDMANESFCKECQWDRVLLSTRIQGIPVYLFHDHKDIRIIIVYSQIPIGGSENIYNQALELIKSNFSKKENFKLSCYCCAKSVVFEEAIIASYEGETIALCGHDCYIKLNEGEKTC